MKIKYLFPVFLTFVLVFSVAVFADSHMTGEEPDAVMQEANEDVQEPRMRDAMMDGNGSIRPVPISAELGNGSMMRGPMGYGSEDAQAIRAMIQERVQEGEPKGPAGQAGGRGPEMMRNQNQVRAAVHAFLALENVTGIGRRVSEIARNYSANFENMAKSEEKIQTRSGLANFFMGGDYASANALEERATQAQANIDAIRSQIEACEEDCSEEMKALLQEQVQVMEQNHARMLELAQSEKAKTGLFGWLRKKE